MKRWLIILFLITFAFTPAAFAHEVRPAYLELRQIGLETYDVLWKVPGQGENLRLGLYVELPAGCTNVTRPRAAMVNSAFIERWTVKCEGGTTAGLTGGTIRIAGLSATMTDVLVRLERLDGTTQVARLTPSSPSMLIERAPSRAQIATTYLRLGVEHILLGIDHLLFVFALLLLAGGWKRVVGAITAFTVAHSLTLAAATLGWVHVPQRPVEVCIALSIVFVAREIMRAGAGLPGLAQRWPWIVAFAFGLLHGFGFAGALSEVGLPQKAIPQALLLFNLGVELGQLLFVTSAAAAMALAWTTLNRIHWNASKVRIPALARIAATYLIGGLAAFWMIDRIGAFVQ